MQINANQVYRLHEFLLPLHLQAVKFMPYFIFFHHIPYQCAILQRQENPKTEGTLRRPARILLVTILQYDYILCLNVL